MEERDILEDIYIDNTISMWGGKNGEVCFELEDGRLLTFNAYNLMRDLPSIVQLTFDEVACEKNSYKRNIKNSLNLLASKFVFIIMIEREVQFCASFFIT